MMDFRRIVVPSSDFRSQSQQDARKVTQHTESLFTGAMSAQIFRDNFKLTTWLALGAFVQALISFLLSPIYAAAPVSLLIAYRFIRAILMHKGIIHNSQMDGVLMGKFSVQVPSKDGAPPKQASEQDLAVIILAARSNHALGIFGPGYRDVSNYINAMVADLWDNADGYGCKCSAHPSTLPFSEHPAEAWIAVLGQTTWVAANERYSNNQVMVLCYFRSMEDLNSYAHGPLHRKAWAWWNGITATHPHISIMHEVYNAPRNHWENIFINNHLTGIAGTQATVNVDNHRVRPLVDASRGSLRTQMGRFCRGDGKENEVYGPE
ncbi:Uncharacterized protein TCAP_01017, partial [Tolypocladium capitatum]